LSATSCTAVGEYENSSDIYVPLAEHWNGTSWAIQSTPSLGTQGGFLSGVSCSSPTSCIAVGLNDNGGVALAEYWNGTSWAVQSTPNPAGTAGSEFSGISCSSATACTAVGSYYDDTSLGYFTFAEYWNGTTWAIQSTPNPTGTEYFPELSGVSCASATACTAVGDYKTSSDVYMPLVEHWNGTSWAIQSTPNLGIYGGSLQGVSCSSSTSCIAVGLNDNSPDGTATLAEYWNGTSWAVQSSPDPAGGTDNTLSGVSCSSATACTAVGFYDTSSDVGETLAEYWNGTSWAILSTPNLADGGQLSGLSCSSATSCTAVGSGNGSLAEYWNGTSWAFQSTPNVPAIANGELYGVSCSSATSCTATGVYVNKSYVDEPLAEHWNGATWSVQSTPNPAGSTGSEFFGVSCPSATSCTAVGDYVRARSLLI